MALAAPTLKSAGIDYQGVLNGRKLRDAITVDGASKLRLIQNPDRPLSWAILPADISPSGDLTKLFSAHSVSREKNASIEHVTSTAPTLSSQIRFKKGVWLAFAHPFREGKRRFVTDEAYVDLGPNEMPPSQGIEILADDVPQPDLLVPPNRDAEIVQAIHAWAERNAIPLATLARENERRISPSTSRSQRLILDLSGLSSDDLKRVSIPLDLVIKIQIER